MVSPVHGALLLSIQQLPVPLLIHLRQLTNQCALPFTMDIVITTQVTPTFTKLVRCVRTSTAPLLPGTSNNGITGTWIPATINTATAGTTTYTFTPTASQCAASVYNGYCDHYTGHSNVYSNWSTVSEQYCTITACTSNNGITGTWSPATINTAAAGTTTYTFTPAASQCATSVYNGYCDHYTGHSNIYSIGPLCQNSTAPLLPGTSNNGITGTWSPCNYQYSNCWYHYLYIYTNC